MKLNSDELAMLQGRDGPAIAKAMDLLCRYGEALDAERLIDTKNVAGTVAATTPFMRDFAQRKGGMDAIFSKFNLDSDETVAIPPAKVFVKTRLVCQTACFAWQFLTQVKPLPNPATPANPSA